MATGKRPRGELRQALITASFELLAESGLAGFSVAELARRLGVSTAAPYRHFRDRDQLLAAVATQAAGELTEAMEAAAADAGEDPVDRLAATAGAYVRFAAARRAGFDVIFARELRPLRDEALAEAGRKLMALLLDLARDAGHPEPADALRSIEQIIALAHGYVTLDTGDFLTGARVSEEDVVTRATRAVTTLLRGSLSSARAG
ncbi:TetR/AcrR family transcriptional regulator [Amycolatopsis magusensis]|uniref:TetR/AcrR family transcriptional regulator n=1 Tax=Amycolatopsis magusensis TaxID=882444 RepID=UPI0037B266C5